MRAQLRLEGYCCRTVFQGVHNMWQFSSGEDHQRRGQSGKPLNQLVFIGKNLDKASLVSSLTACQSSKP